MNAYSTTDFNTCAMARWTLIVHARLPVGMSMGFSMHPLKVVSLSFGQLFFVCFSVHRSPLYHT